MVVIKTPNGNDNETQKLLNREIKNYSEIKGFFIPKFYDIVEGTNYPLIEIINSKTLLDIEELNLSYEDKINILTNNAY